MLTDLWKSLQETKETKMALTTNRKRHITEATPPTQLPPEHVSRIGNSCGGPPGQGCSSADPSLASAREGPAERYWQSALDPMGGTALNIINLSDYQLSVDEMALLSKGLTFCPSSNMDTFETIKDLHLFAHKLILKSLYAKPKQVNEYSLKTKQLRTWSPYWKIRNRKNLLMI